MNRFQHGHDGVVVVEGGGALYMDTPANFALDAGLAAPDLPGLIYAPGRMNCVISAAGDQGASGLTAPQRAALDAVINNAPQLVAAQVARTAVAPTPAEKLQAEYAKRGVTADRIALALLDNDAAQLQALRDAAAAAKAEVAK